jgi:hypothetical protein
LSQKKKQLLIKTGRQHIISDFVHQKMPRVVYRPPRSYGQENVRRDINVPHHDDVSDFSDPDEEEAAGKND